jgi:biofilm PGA synthesis N-glycosyltransferase PgaC
MSIVLFLLFLFLFFYFAILLWLAIGFLATKTFTSLENHPPTPLTLIICARNEEKNITLCLRTLFKQDYSASFLQVILVDDASSDQTIQRAEAVLNGSGISYRIISNKTQLGKKRSILSAMAFVANELIVLRDADTFTVSDKWLQTISGFYQEHRPDLLIAPVAIANYSGILWALQAIETNVLSVFAAGSAFYKKAFLCSGANLCFTKTIFEKANGYSSHLHLASGDDVLFLEDVKRIEGARVAYLKSDAALVYTYPCLSFGDLLRQKTRWAAKFSKNKNKFNFLFALLSFMVNIGWLICFVSISLTAEHRFICLMFVLLKLIIDILLLFLASGFIKNKNLLWFGLPVGCIYPIYAYIVGINSLMGKPKWK